MSWVSYNKLNQFLNGLRTKFTTNELVLANADKSKGAHVNVGGQDGLITLSPMSEDGVTPAALWITDSEANNATELTGGTLSYVENVGAEEEDYTSVSLVGGVVNVGGKNGASKRITNVADPVNDNDAVNLKFLNQSGLGSGLELLEPYESVLGIDNIDFTTSIKLACFKHTLGTYKAIIDGTETSCELLQIIPTALIHIVYYLKTSITNNPFKTSGVLFRYKLEEAVDTRAKLKYSACFPQEGITLPVNVKLGASQAGDATLIVRVAVVSSGSSSFWSEVQVIIRNLDITPTSSYDFIDIHEINDEDIAWGTPLYTTNSSICS